jgi:hypothetical protein
LNSSQLTLINRLAQGEISGMVLQQMADHDKAPGFLGLGGDGTCLLHRQGHRLLDEDVFARAECLDGYLGVAFGRSGNGDRVNIGRSKEFFPSRMRYPELGCGRVGPVSVNVGYSLKCAQPMECSYQIATPPAAADHGNFSRLVGSVIDHRGFVLVSCIQFIMHGKGNFFRG